MTPKIAQFLRDAAPATPCLVLDVDRVEENYRRLQAAMPQARMQALLDWLRPQDAPRFVLLPRAEYTRLQAQWQLPALRGDAR